MIRAMIAAVTSVLLVEAAAAQKINLPVKKNDPPPKGPTEFLFTLTTPIQLLYLEAEAVRTELKLAREQSDKIIALSKRWTENARQVDLERGSTGADAAAMARETRKQLDEILTVAQMKRLDQVILRHREKEHGMSAVLATVARDLKLSNDQQERFELLRRKRADRILEYLTMEERANAIHRSIHNANNDFVEAVEKLLTKDQDARLKELLGEPLSAEIKLPEPQAVALENNVVESVYLGPLVDNYGVEAEIIANESVHKELKMDDDQIRKAKEFTVEWREAYSRRRMNGSSEVQAIQELNEYVRTKLPTLLTPIQRTRFDQISMQYRKNKAGELAALGHPAARDFRDRETTMKIFLNEPIEKILTGEVYPAFRRALGEPFRGEMKINSPLRVTRSGTVVKPNVALPVVEINRLTIAKFMIENSRRYRLEDEQVTRLKEIDEDLPKLRKLLHRELSQLPPSTDISNARMIPEAKAVEEFRKSVFEQCFNVLDKKQQSLWGAELRAARGAIIDY